MRIIVPWSVWREDITCITNPQKNSRILIHLFSPTHIFLSAAFIPSPTESLVKCNFILNPDRFLSFSLSWLHPLPYLSPRHTFPFPSSVQHNSFPLSLQFILGSVFAQHFSSLPSPLTSLHIFRNLFPSQHFLPCFDPSSYIRAFSSRLPRSSSLLFSEDILSTLFQGIIIFVRRLFSFVCLTIFTLQYVFFSS